MSQSVVNGFTTTPRLPCPKSDRHVHTSWPDYGPLQGASSCSLKLRDGGTLTDQGYTLTNQEEVPAPLAGTQRPAMLSALSQDESSEQMIVFPYPWP